MTTPKSAKANLEFLRTLREENHYTYKEMAELTEYSEEYVRSWFAPESSTKFRIVPDRAVMFVKLKSMSKAS